MSYSIRLVRKKSHSKIKKVSSSELPRGGTYCAPTGDTIMEHDLFLNITYNFAWYLYKTIDEDLGVRWIYGKKGKDVIERLGQAKAKCEEMAEEEAKNKCIISETWGADEPYDEERVSHDYWYPCARHAADAISGLIFLAVIAPDFTFSGD